MVDELGDERALAASAEEEGRSVTTSGEEEVSDGMFPGLRLKLFPERQVASDLGGSKNNNAPY